MTGAMYQTKEWIKYASMPVILSENVLRRQTYQMMENRHRCSKVLSLDEKDIETFEELKKLGVKFDVRKVPSDSQDNMDEILKKAKAELAK